MPRGIYKRKPFTKEHIQNGANARRGSKRSLETRMKMSLDRKGHWQQQAAKITGELNYKWKGEKASYFTKHMWLHNHFGTASKCENLDCKYPRKNGRGYMMLKPKRYEWANVSGKYFRDRKDYLELCSSCHRLMDMGRIKIKLLKE